MIRELTNKSNPDLIWLRACLDDCADTGIPKNKSYQMPGWVNYVAITDWKHQTIEMSYLRGTSGRSYPYVPEVRTRCLIKFKVSHPHDGWARSKKRDPCMAGCWFLGGW